MFIVKKKVGEGIYYYLRKSQRIDGKVRAITVAYLGKNKKEAEKRAKKLKLELEKKVVKGDNKVLKQQKLDDVMVESNLEDKKVSIEDISVFCKKKGFVFRSSEIYGGFSGFWDFGPLGVELFNNLKKNWWSYFVTQKENMTGMEASIISHPRTWQASGHVASFSDIAVVCKNCKNATKIDKAERGKVKCEKCGGEFEEQGEFSLMFKTKVGALNAEEAYLRGETAQGMFMDFKLVQESSRKQLPFGIAQIGRCFRNEIAPRDFLFRSREFHIGEFEFFIHPEDKKCDLLDKAHLEVSFRLLDEETQNRMEKNLPDKSPSLKVDDLKETTIKQMLEEKRLGEWHAYWLAEQILWFYSLGLDKIKIREHTKDELSHYSSATFDIDYEYPFGSKEVAGIANRGQYDLTQHIKESKEKLEVFDQASGKQVVPRVIEPTFGMERVFLAIIVNAYKYDKVRDNIILTIPANLSPIKASIFPIIKKPEYEEIAKEIFTSLNKEWNVSYDRSGSIGRRYSRADESGTPMCITIDEKTPEDKSVTIRDRDSTQQVRVKISELKEVVRRVVNGDSLLTLGKKVETRIKEN